MAFLQTNRYSNVGFELTTSQLRVCCPPSYVVEGGIYKVRT